MLESSSKCSIFLRPFRAPPTAASGVWIPLISLDSRALRRGASRRLFHELESEAGSPSLECFHALNAYNTTIHARYAAYYRAYICSRVPCQYTPPTVWSPLALAPGLGPSIGLCKTTSHPSSLYFLTFFNESPANTIG